MWLIEGLRGRLSVDPGLRTFLEGGTRKVKSHNSFTFFFLFEKSKVDETPQSTSSL